MWGLSAERQGGSDEAMGIYHRVLGINPNFTAARNRLNLPPPGAPAADGIAKQNRSQLWLPTTEEAEEYGTGLPAARLAEFRSSWRLVPRWYLGLAATFVVLVVICSVAFLIWIFRTNANEMMQQCRFALENMGESDLPPGCRERLGLDD